MNSILYIITVIWRMIMQRLCTFIRMLLRYLGVTIKKSRIVLLCSGQRKIRCCCPHSKLKAQALKLIVLIVLIVLIASL